VKKNASRPSRIKEGRKIHSQKGQGARDFYQKIKEKRLAIAPCSGVPAGKKSLTRGERPLLHMSSRYGEAVNTCNKNAGTLVIRAAGIYNGGTTFLHLARSNGLLPRRGKSQKPGKEGR